MQCEQSVPFTNSATVGFCGSATGISHLILKDLGRCWAGFIRIDDGHDFHHPVILVIEDVAVLHE